jgi:divalent metal cation (Fe/Co/Zn/Cd) transporter
MLLTPTAGPTAARRLVLRRRVQLLLAATITYNVIEAVVAIIAGRAASSTALIGFGLDSIIEVSSAAAIVWQFSSPNHEQRERTALRVIAISFFALAAYVTVESLRTLLLDERAAHSPVGIVLAAASLLIMPTLSMAQRRTGRELQSSSAIADSKQTLLCTYLSGALLVGLGANLLLGWWWTDPVVVLFIGVLAIKEGREAWRGDTCCSPVAAISATRGSGSACDDACCRTTGRDAPA